VIDNHREQLELLHGSELQTSHRKALRAMVRCPAGQCSDAVWMPGMRAQP